MDIWAHYAYLEGLGWTQQRIAEAKGIQQAMVSYRLKLHQLPEKIKVFINQGSLEETHLLEISKLSIDLYFSPWLTTSQAWEELANKAIYDKGKNGSKFGLTLAPLVPKPDVF